MKQSNENRVADAIVDAAQAVQDTGTFEALLEDLEPAIVRAQFKRAVERLEKHLDEKIEEDGAQGGRHVLEMMALIVGDRRKKAMNVQVERRAPGPENLDPDVSMFHKVQAD